MNVDVDIPERDKQLILIVDDEVVSRVHIENTLLQDDYNVITAENGKQALAQAIKHAPDMIVMDVVLPIMDGFEACIAIREQETQFQVPIIMLTDLNDITAIERSFDVGATDFIVKPVNLSIFKQRIRNGLKSHQTALELYRHQSRQTHANKIAQLGFWDWDIKNRQLYWSDEVYSLLSIKPGEFKDNRQAFSEKVSEKDLDKIKAATTKTLKYGTPYNIEHHLLRSDKQVQVVSQHAELIKDKKGKVIRMLGIVQDITKSYLAQEKIKHQAYYDSLTDLPNRTLFHNRLDHALKISDRFGTNVAVLLIDLDQFKKINDSLGHDIGDQFLKFIASSLKDIIRTTDTISRLGGDEFAIIIEGVSGPRGIHKVASKIIETLATTQHVKGHELVSTGSVGITISSPAVLNKEHLIKQADLAMYHSKGNGGNQYTFYNEEMKFKAHKFLRLEKELRQALHREELQLYYQPKVNLHTNKIIGMEALIRWQHPGEGLIPPFDFIPIAEETGIIVEIGKWVLETACKQTKQWHQQGFDDLVVSINVSVKQLQQEQRFSDEVESALRKSNLDSRFLDIEITENCTMNNLDSVIQVLSTLREIGVTISMDNFGSGFSSLSFLNSIPLDALKIDRAFIKNIENKDSDSKIAKLIIAIAKSLNLKVVAEGIETQEHLDFLKSNNCDQFQGFLFSPPIPSQDFEQFLKTHEENAFPQETSQPEFES